MLPTPPRQFAAIPTRLEGVNYRSRLEARWAAMFRSLGWKFEYEPFDLNGWIPNFVLIGEAGQILVEIKPRIDMVDFAKVTAVDYETLCVSATPFDDFGQGLVDWQSPVLPFGILIGPDSLGDNNAAWGYPDFACINRAKRPYSSGERYDFVASNGHYRERLSGLYDGDHHLSLTDEDAALFRWHWQQGQNRTQWGPVR